MLYTIEQDDSAEIPEALRVSDAVLVGDAAGVVGGLNCSLAQLKADHPVLGTFFARFPKAVFVAARDRVFVLSSKKAAHMAMCVSATANDLGGS